MPKLYGNPPTRLKQVLMEIAHHQSYFSLIFNWLFLVQVSTIRNGDIWGNMKANARKMPSVMLTNVKFWPAINFVNYYYYPLEYRVLCINVVAIFWMCYMSYVQQNVMKEMAVAKAKYEEEEKLKS